MATDNDWATAEMLDRRATENERLAARFEADKQPSLAFAKKRLASAQRHVAADLRGEDTENWH